MTNYDGPERREKFRLTREQRMILEQMIAEAIKQYPTEEIAERAAVKATEKLTNDFYISIGKSVFNKARFLFVLGVIAAGVLMWLQSKGFFIKGGM